MTKSKTFFSLLILVLTLLALPSLAGAGAVKDYVTLKGMSPSQAISIQFTLPVDPESVNPENIYAENLKNGELHNLELELSEDQTLVKISPDPDYLQGTPYRIHIEQGIRTQEIPHRNLSRKVTIFMGIRNGEIDADKWANPVEIKLSRLGEGAFIVKDTLVPFSGPYILYLDRVAMREYFGEVIDNMDEVMVRLGDKEWIAGLNPRNRAQYIAQIPTTDIQSKEELNEAIICIR